ncbi:hypothetical protein ACFSPU_11740 [Haoranjiania flava]|uniref:Uncharacterized protein n=1 Tax=Haoranjiania flava TaxID=1856322 RepID=A0AAE3IM31_9BACT|nr:hypothetical protein [Haoranjiania flava]MCU7693515.1 hypothetical protein [Haoranjiania flava]
MPRLGYAGMPVEGKTVRNSDSCCAAYKWDSVVDDSQQELYREHKVFPGRTCAQATSCRLDFFVTFLSRNNHKD